jgi:hypothetical protein
MDDTAAVIPRYDRDHLPSGEWAGYRWRHDRAFASRMVPVSGPFVVVDQEGFREFSAGWQGFMAIARDGSPAPIPINMHTRTYERIDADPGPVGPRRTAIAVLGPTVSAIANLLFLVVVAHEDGGWLLCGLLGLNAVHFACIAIVAGLRTEGGIDE